MGPYVMVEDLYKYKLALILGRGEKLKKILKQFPTEKKFKKSSIQQIASVIGIKNLQSTTLNKLKRLDTTYDRMVTFKSDFSWSNSSRARKLMGIDTEYLNSELDCIQYVIVENFELITSGFIFTNNDLAPSISPVAGINILRNIIEENLPDLIVGHNFNSDISILEKAYGDSLPELYNYDDTMKLMKNSNLANIIGGYSLDVAIQNLFNEEVIGLFSAYKNLELLMEYGIKDAVYPIFIRHYILNGEMPEINFELRLDKVLKEENRSYLQNDNFTLSFRN